MTNKQWQRWKTLVCDCKSGKYHSINVGGKATRQVVIAMDNQWEQLLTEIDEKSHGQNYQNSLKNGTMTRLEILSEETGLLIEKVIFYTKEDEFFITGKEALEAMKRFGKIVYNYKAEQTLYLGDYMTYDEWLKEQEEKQ